MFPLPAFPTTDVVTRAAVVEGYNTNTYQAQDDPNLPIVKRHPSPFTALDLDVELRWPGRDTDLTTARVEARANHYEPLNGEYQSDDAAANAGFTWRRAITPRTTLTFGGAATLTTINGAHVTDGTIFQFDPTQVRRTYWLTDATFGAIHALGETWHLHQSFGAIVSGTVYQPPTALPGGSLLGHRGLDYVMPYMQTDLDKDVSERTRVDVTALYQYAFDLYVLDLSRSPPRNVGPEKAAFLTLLAGYTHHFTPEIATVTRAGAVVASAPAHDADPRPVLSPAASQEFYWSRPFFDLVASGGYTFGTVNPRLGEGPTATANVLAMGFPHHVGKWKDVALIARAQLSWSALATSATSSVHLGLYAAGGEIRAGLNRWLGVLVGYDVRYATFDGPQFVPSFLQHVFFAGLSGYFSSDRSQLPLTTFTAPVQPPA